VAEFVRLGAVAVAYSLAYALTGLLLHRKLFARRTPKLAGLLCVLIAAGTSLIPMIVLFVGNKLSLNTFEKLQPGSVFNAFAVKHAEDQMIHLYVALAWLFVVALLSLKWFRMQVKNFRPIDRAAESLPQPQPPAMPPPLPAQP
jgi:hypothetical protein